MLEKWHKQYGFSIMVVLVAAALLAVPALAGGVVVSLDAMPPDFPPGTPITVGFTILSAHDGSAQSELEPVITLRNVATGETVRVKAKLDGTAGHYTAEITLPSAGQWDWEIQPYGPFTDNYPASVMTPIQVTGTAAAAASAAAPAVITLPLPVVLLLAGSALALAVAFGMRFSNRRHPAAR